jgi:hypothetical protein
MIVSPSENGRTALRIIIVMEVGFNLIFLWPMKQKNFLGVVVIANDREGEMKGKSLHLKT